jgi:hypothetical protein
MLTLLILGCAKLVEPVAPPHERYGYEDVDDPAAELTRRRPTVRRPARALAVRRHEYAGCFRRATGAASPTLIASVPMTSCARRILKSARTAFVAPNPGYASSRGAATGAPASDHALAPEAPPNSPLKIRHRQAHVPRSTLSPKGDHWIAVRTTRKALKQTAAPRRDLHRPASRPW